MARRRRDYTAAASSSDKSRVDVILLRLKNHPVVAVTVVVCIVIVATAATTDAVDKLVDLSRRLRTPVRPEYGELIESVHKYAIDARIVRTHYQGPIVITPVAMFSDPGTLADGSPSGYTYLLARFTNTSASPITVGMLLGDRDAYVLADLRFGYRPTFITLYQIQGFARGMPLSHEQRLAADMFGAATIPAHSTRYGYINSLGKPWPSQITFDVIDVTDNSAGSARLEIDSPATKK